MTFNKLNRCGWVSTSKLFINYHDKEWGVPVKRDRKHFEFLCLEGAQAGLSWSTVLKKRPAYRMAFDNFDPKQIARYTEKKYLKLLNNPGIIRNRLKIKSAISNAKAFLKVQKKFGSFNKYIWNFVDGKPIVSKFTSLSQIPAVTPLAEKISQDLKSRGFNFVGPTIIYAHMQASGLVNDHLVSCFRYQQLGGK